MVEHAREVAPVTHHDDERPDEELTMDELAHRQGVRPIRSLDELGTGGFSSDEEVEEFIAFTYAARRRDLA